MAIMGRFPSDNNEPSFRDLELACAADREWAGCHGHRPGTWRVRLRVGLEGPPARFLTPAEQGWRWTLVIVLSCSSRLRMWFLTDTDARLAAAQMGLRPEDER